VNSSVGNQNLIPCPDCGKWISKMAVSCPNCGRPLKN
jgi:predicted amidophosphoribosyltransferase